jgi:hypothetical protein
VTSPADATPEQRRAYELECAAALQRRFDHNGHQLFNGRRFTALDLRGEYPDTKLVVTFVDATGIADSESFGIWRDDPPGDVTAHNDWGLRADLIWIAVEGM